MRSTDVARDMNIVMKKLLPEEHRMAPGAVTSNFTSIVRCNVAFSFGGFF